MLPTSRCRSTSCRARCPDHFITHNLMGFGYDRLNYFDLARNLDFLLTLLWATTRDAVDHGTKCRPQFLCTQHRYDAWAEGEKYLGDGTAGGVGRVGNDQRGAASRGAAAVGVPAANLAHGSGCHVFCPWSICAVWYGTIAGMGLAQPMTSFGAAAIMKSNAWVPRSRRTGGQILGSLVESTVADHNVRTNSRFAFQIQPNNPGFSYPEHFHQIYRAFYQQHAVDSDYFPGCRREPPISSSSAPALHLLTQATAENLERYVGEAGGTLVVTQRTGVKDEWNTVVQR